MTTMRELRAERARWEALVEHYEADYRTLHAVLAVQAIYGDRWRSRCPALAARLDHHVDAALDHPCELTMFIVSERAL